MQWMFGWISSLFLFRHTNEYDFEWTSCLSAVQNMVEHCWPILSLSVLCHSSAKTLLYPFTTLYAIGFDIFDVIIIFIVCLYTNIYSTVMYIIFRQELRE